MDASNTMDERFGVGALFTTVGVGSSLRRIVEDCVRLGEVDSPVFRVKAHPAIIGGR